MFLSHHTKAKEQTFTEPQIESKKSLAKWIVVKLRKKKSEILFAATLCLCGTYTKIRCMSTFSFTPYLHI